MPLVRCSYWCNCNIMKILSCLDLLWLDFQLRFKVEAFVVSTLEAMKSNFWSCAFPFFVPESLLNASHVELHHGVWDYLGRSCAAQSFAWISVLIPQGSGLEYGWGFMNSKALIHACNVLHDYQWLRWFRRWWGWQGTIADMYMCDSMMVSGNGSPGLVDSSIGDPDFEYIGWCRPLLASFQHCYMDLIDCERMTWALFPIMM